MVTAELDDDCGDEELHLHLNQTPSAALSEERRFSGAHLPTHICASNVFPKVFCPNSRFKASPGRTLAPLLKPSAAVPSVATRWRFGSWPRDSDEQKTEMSS